MKCLVSDNTGCGDRLLNLIEIETRRPLINSTKNYTTTTLIHQKSLEGLCFRLRVWGFTVVSGSDSTQVSRVGLENRGGFSRERTDSTRQ